MIVRHTQAPVLSQGVMVPLLTQVRPVQQAAEAEQDWP
jgi:hypothetical protein